MGVKKSNIVDVLAKAKIKKATKEYTSASKADGPSSKWANMGKAKTSTSTAVAKANAAKIPTTVTKEVVKTPTAVTNGKKTTQPVPNIPKTNLTPPAVKTTQPAKDPVRTIQPVTGLKTGPLTKKKGY